MRYRAFISYASADRVVGARFHRAIEHFRIPKPLRGREHGRGPVPARLTPIFRDRTDADAGVRLADTLRAALEGSDALVVLCSIMVCDTELSAAASAAAFSLVCAFMARA